MDDMDRERGGRERRGRVGERKIVGECVRMCVRGCWGFRERREREIYLRGRESERVCSLRDLFSESEREGERVRVCALCAL